MKLAARSFLIVMLLAGCRINRLAPGAEAPTAGIGVDRPPVGGTGGSATTSPPKPGTGGSGAATPDAAVADALADQAGTTLPGAPDATVDQSNTGTTDVAADRGPDPASDVNSMPPSPPPPRACPASTSAGEFGVYAGGGVGNCSFATNTLPMQHASVDSELYAKSASCGSCLEVSGPRGKVIATVVDHLPMPPGPRGHRFLLNRPTLVQVAGPGLDLAFLDWRWVPCPVTGSIVAALKEGSNQFYWEVMLTNTTNPVVKFEFATAAAGPWTVVPREAYNYFRHISARGLPVRLRLTDEVGSVVTTGDLKWPTAPVTTPVPLGVQFSAACAP